MNVTMITLEMTGLDALEKSLMTLGEDIALNVIKDAGIKAMQPVMADMARNAGYDPANTGEHMRDTIKIRSRSRMKEGRWPTLVTFRVGPSGAHTIKAVAQEFGTRKQVADPFMRPALDNHIPQILNTLAAEIRAGINSDKNRS